MLYWHTFRWYSVYSESIYCRSMILEWAFCGCQWCPSSWIKWKIPSQPLWESEVIFTEASIRASKCTILDEKRGSRLSPCTRLFWFVSEERRSRLIRIRNMQRKLLESRFFSCEISLSSKTSNVALRHAMKKIWIAYQGSVLNFASNILNGITMSIVYAAL